MSVRTTQTTTNHDTIVNSRSRYRGRRATKRTPGQITPLILRPESNLTNYEADVTNYEHRIMTSYEGDIDNAMQNPRIKNELLKIDTYEEYELEAMESCSARKDEIDQDIWNRGIIDAPQESKDEEQHIAPTTDYTTIHQRHATLKESKATVQIKMSGYNVTKSKCLTALRRRSLSPSDGYTKPGYVETLRLRHLKLNLAKIPTVSLPQIIVTPPIPTLITSEEHSIFSDYSFLSPPPVCHRRKDRERWARMEYERILMLRDRVNSAQTNTETEEIESDDQKLDSDHLTDLKCSTQVVPQRTSSMKAPTTLYQGQDKEAVITHTQQIQQRMKTEIKALKENNDPEPLHHAAVEKEAIVTHTRKIQHRMETEIKSKKVSNQFEKFHHMGQEKEALRSTALDYEKNVISRLGRLGF